MDFDQKAMDVLKLLESLPKEAPQNIVRDFSRGEVFLLNYLYTNGGKARPGEISEALGMSTARTAAALKNMERKGWVRRSANPSDRRSIIAGMTRQGKTVIEQCRRFIFTTVRDVLERLGERDTTEFFRITQRIADITHDIKPDGIYDQIQQTLMEG